MKVDLFGVGTQSKSRAITAQKRINCYVERRQETEKGRFVLIGRPGLTPFVSTLGANPTRGMWAVNTLAAPLTFVVQGNQLISINNAGSTVVIGTINTSSGDVSLADDGTTLVLVDGVDGWYYNMVTPGALTLIGAANFTANPMSVTWQDTYFIVTDALTGQFQLSDGADAATWPAENIGFTGSAPGRLRAGIAANSILNLYGDTFAEFWQNSGGADFPYATIPGSSQEFGLAAPWSLSKFDNSVVGVFQSKLGGKNIARMAGFGLQRLSDTDIETLLSQSAVGAGSGYAFMSAGHPMYVFNAPAASLTLMYDGLSQVWSELRSYGQASFVGLKYATFGSRRLLSSTTDGTIYELSETAYSDDGDPLVMEVQSKHIWEADKFIGIQRVQIDIEAGVGNAASANPVMDLQVSQDGGNTFASVGYSSMGPVGEYLTRVTWNSLGAARDWVLKLVISDPVKRIVTGATAELSGASF